MKMHDLKLIIIDGIAVHYFYQRLKNDINGNPRYKLYIIDHDAPAVYEKTYTTYNIEDSVKRFIEEGA